eukprot:10759124-Alexandrium_andersonii.AAC.1
MQRVQPTSHDTHDGCARRMTRQTHRASDDRGRTPRSTPTDVNYKTTHRMLACTCMRRATRVLNAQPTE